MNLEIEECRMRIDQIDHDLLCLLNERTMLAVELALIKQRLGMPARDREREQHILMCAQKDNGGPLDESAVARIFQLIICESRRAQSRLSKARTTAPCAVQGDDALTLESRE